MSDSQNSLSVSELTLKIKKLIEPEFSDVWVKGEISNYIHHSSYLNHTNRSSTFRYLFIFNSF